MIIPEILSNSSIDKIAILEQQVAELIKTVTKIKKTLIK